MGKFIDFAAVKSAVSFSDAIELLDLKLTLAGNQFRGPCPCGKGDRRALVVTDPDGWFCQGAKQGGDVIALAAHVLDLRMRDAAIELAERAGFEGGTVGTSTSKVHSTRERAREREAKAPPVRERGAARSDAPPSSGFDAARYAAGLDYEHERLIEAGGDPEKLRAFGIGYAARGIHRGRIVARVYDPETGEEAFVPLEGEINLPPQLKTNVVPYRKRA